MSLLEIERFRSIAKEYTNASGIENFAMVVLDEFAQATLLLLPDAKISENWVIRL